MKALVIKLGALGDVVMATPIIDVIVRAHQREEVWLLTTPAYAPLLREWPGVRIRTFDRHSLRGLFGVIAWIRRSGFDRIYDLQSNDRSAVICALAGVRERVGNHTRFPYTHHPRERWRGQSHIFERMNEVLASAGLPRGGERPLLPATSEESERVAHWLQGHRLAPAGYAVLHAGCSPAWPTKRWPHFGELAAMLEGRGVRAVWAGAATDAGVNRALAARAGIDATGCFSFTELAELGRRARFALTNDSGPMHILSASGIPVYAFFGPTDWRRNHALGQRDRVIASEAPCAGCRRRRREAADHTCLSGIPACDVLDRLQRDGLLWASSE